MSDTSNKITVKWVLGILLLPSLYAAWSGIVWAVDTRVQQQLAPQMQQLRKDILSDFQKKRMDFLIMKETAGIITDEERVELKYLQDQL
jgi:hypothetical protein